MPCSRDANPFGNLPRARRLAELTQRKVRRMVAESWHPTLPNYIRVVAVDETIC
jgi:hypothetical protein